MTAADGQYGNDTALVALAERLSTVLRAAGIVLRSTDLLAAADGTPLVDSDGHVLAVLPDPPALRDADPVVREAVGGLVDAYQYVLNARGEVRRANMRAEHAERDANEDHLTGLPNRRAWEQALGREQARCERNESRVAIAVVDMDDLKVVNDKHGHLAGDLLVRQTADLLQHTFRGADVVARIGGDEFAVLVVDFDCDHPNLLASRIRDTLGAAGVRASVGAAAHTNGQHLSDVFATADAAMYADKRSNRRHPKNESTGQ